MCGHGGTQRRGLQGCGHLDTVREADTARVSPLFRSCDEVLISGTAHCAVGWDTRRKQERNLRPPQWTRPVRREELCP